MVILSPQLRRCLTSAHYAQERVVHIPFPLLKVVRGHWRRNVCPIGAVRPVAVAAHDDKALRTVADEPVAAHVHEQYVARIVYIGVAVLVFSSCHLSHGVPFCASICRPFSVRRYFCKRLRGFSGMVYSMMPSDNNILMTLRK